MNFEEYKNLILSAQDGPKCLPQEKWEIIITTEPNLMTHLSYIDYLINVEERNFLIIKSSGAAIENALILHKLVQ